MSREVPLLLLRRSAALLLTLLLSPGRPLALGSLALPTAELLSALLPGPLVLRRLLALPAAVPARVTLRRAVLLAALLTTALLLARLSLTLLGPLLPGSALLVPADLRELILSVALVVRRGLALVLLAALFGLSRLTERLLGADVVRGLVVARFATVLEPLVRLSLPAALLLTLLSGLALLVCQSLLVALTLLAALPLLTPMAALWLLSLLGRLVLAAALGALLLRSALVPLLLAPPPALSAGLLGLGLLAAAAGLLRGLTGPLAPLASSLPRGGALLVLPTLVCRAVRVLSGIVVIVVSHSA